MTPVNGYPDHIFSALDLALRTLRKELNAAMSTQTRMAGLRSSQLRLISLVPAEGMRATDLAARVGMTKQALGEFASSLEALGLLESTGDPADRRVRRINLTSAGLEVAAISDREIETMEARWRDRLGAETWDAMKATLLSINQEEAPSQLSPPRRQPE